MNSPYASIVVPTFERPEMLARCLDCVHAAIANAGRDDVEVIVTDASHSDATARMLAERFPTVRHVAGPKHGPASNRNHGARQARGEWLLFTDDDCLPDPRWVAAMLDAVRAGRGRVLEGPTLTDRPRRRLDEEAPYNPSGGYLWACNMAVEKAVFDALGGFCEQFVGTAGSEDTDLRLRLAKAGHALAFVPDAVVCHPWRRARPLRFQFAVGRSYLLLCERHPEMLGDATWGGVLLYLLRSGRILLVESRRVGLAGLGFELGRLAIGTGFSAVAVARRRSARARTKPPGQPSIST